MTNFIRCNIELRNLTESHGNEYIHLTVDTLNNVLLHDC